MVANAGRCPTVATGTVDRRCGPSGVSRQCSHRRPGSCCAGPQGVSSDWSPGPRQLRPADLVRADLVLCADRADQRDVARLGQGVATVRFLRWYEADSPTTNAPVFSGVLLPSSSQAFPAVRSADAQGGSEVALCGELGAGHVPEVSALADGQCTDGGRHWKPKRPWWAGDGSSGNP